MYRNLILSIKSVAPVEINVSIQNFNITIAESYYYYRLFYIHGHHQTFFESTYIMFSNADLIANWIQISIRELQQRKYFTGNLNYSFAEWKLSCYNKYIYMFIYRAGRQLSFLWWHIRKL